MVPLMLIFLLSYKDPKFYSKKNYQDTEKITTQLLDLEKIRLCVYYIRYRGCFVHSCGTRVLGKFYLGP